MKPTLTVEEFNDFTEAGKLQIHAEERFSNGNVREWRVVGVRYDEDDEVIVVEVD